MNIAVSDPFATFLAVSAPAPQVGVDGQLYDSSTGSLLYDDVTGAPLVW